MGRYIDKRDANRNINESARRSQRYSQELQPRRTRDEAPTEPASGASTRDFDMLHLYAPRTRRTPQHLALPRGQNQLLTLAFVHLNLAFGAIAGGAGLIDPTPYQALPGGTALPRRGLRQAPAVTLDMPTFPVGQDNAFAQAPITVSPQQADTASGHESITLTSTPGHSAWARSQRNAPEGQVAMTFSTVGPGAQLDLQGKDGTTSGLAQAIGQLVAGAHQATLTWDEATLQAIVDGVTTTLPRTGSLPLAPAFGCQDGGSATVTIALYNAAQSSETQASDTAPSSLPVPLKATQTLAPLLAPASVSLEPMGPAPAQALAPADDAGGCAPPTQNVTTGLWSAYDKYDPVYDAHITYTQTPDAVTFAAATGGLTLAVDDNFAQQAILNASRWATGNDDFHGGNAELENYRPSQVTMRDNAGVKLTAVDNGNGTYTSGKIYAVDPSIALQTGAIEFRASVPKGAGLWPAFWLLPRGANNAAGNDPQWPVTGEIDNEIEGGYSHEVHGTVHTGAAPNADTAVGGIFDGCTDFADGKIHAFQTLWDKAQMSWFIDGIRYKQIRYADLDSDLGLRMQNTFAGGTWFAPIINLAVGGAFDARAKTADAIKAAGTQFPAGVTLESVKIYRP